MIIIKRITVKSYVCFLVRMREEIGPICLSIHHVTYVILITDKHDMVVRFNHAPTEGYEADVGTKTTLRIVNSQVVSKPSFNFMNSPLYENVTLLAWDPSNYSSTLDEVPVSVILMFKPLSLLSK